MKQYFTCYLGNFNIFKQNGDDPVKPPVGHESMLRVMRQL